MSLDSIKALFRPEIADLHAYRVPAVPPAVKLDANESPWALPGEAWEAVVSAVRSTDLHRYPDGRATALRQALARTLGGTQDQFVFGN
ncbi:MAG: histidinol-phosphate transaminase, partial [Myxococcota bacterium]